MSKPLLHISGGATTGIYQDTLRCVSELDKKLDDMLTQWVFMGKGSGLELRRLDGSIIRYAEMRFKGDPELVYWGNWLDEFIENDAVDILHDLAEAARDSGYEVERCITEAADLLCIMVMRVYERKADVAALLSGDGVVKGERMDVSETIDTMQDVIRQHARIVIAENAIQNGWLLNGTSGASWKNRLKELWKRFRVRWRS